MAITMTHANIANMIPDAASRHAWIAAGQPTDLGTVARIVVKARSNAITPHATTHAARQIKRRTSPTR